MELARRGADAFGATRQAPPKKGQAGGVDFAVVLNMRYRALRQLEADGIAKRQRGVNPIDGPA
jgi:hypothetical protein